MGILEHLHRALPRRDVLAKDGDRWGDPRARLLAGERWIAAQPRVLKALGLEAGPARHLAELASALHAAYVQVADGLPGNAAVQINDGKLKLGRLGKADEPALMPRFRQMVNNMLPTVDFPELLLEISELTDLADAFTHISGAGSSMEDFATSICAVWLSEACNVGLTQWSNRTCPHSPAAGWSRSTRATSGRRLSPPRTPGSSRPSRRSTSSGRRRRRRRCG